MTDGYRDHHTLFMASHTTDTAIRSRIDAFLSEVSGLVRKAALESVQEALGKKPRASGRPRSGGRTRRSADDLAKIGARVLARVRSKQGQRLEEIGRALGRDTGELKKPIAVLLAARKLKTKGRKRGTKYFAR